jgi:hypothetical protein
MGKISQYFYNIISANYNFIHTKKTDNTTILPFSGIVRCTRPLCRQRPSIAQSRDFSQLASFQPPSSVHPAAAAPSPVHLDHPAGSTLLQHPRFASCSTRARLLRLLLPSCDWVETASAGGLLPRRRARGSFTSGRRGEAGGLGERRKAPPPSLNRVAQSM